MNRYFDWEVLIIAITITICVVSIVAGIYFSSIASSQRLQERQANCIENGGSWIPTGTDPMCLKLK